MEKKQQTKEEILQEWALIQRAQKDSALFSGLYSTYFKPIYLFIFRRVSHEAVAEDICNLVFSKALHKLSDYRFKGVPFSAWLYKIALNEIHSYYRQTKRERVVYFSSETLELLSKNIQGEDEFSNQEELEHCLMNAMEQLSTEEMLYIEMRFFENRSFREISEIQHITENNAKVKTYRIIERLRKLIVIPKRNA